MELNAEKNLMCVNVVDCKSVRAQYDRSEI